LRVVVIVLALGVHLFGFRIGLGLGIDENRYKGSKENSYPTQQIKAIHLTNNI
jgi:hypothetical protein